MGWVVPLLLFVLVGVYGEPQVPCVFIFSDSLSENGNNNNLPTLAKFNYKPYGIDFINGPTGRPTNSRNAVDILTQLLGFENFIPPFANTSGSDILKGVNYASAAAGIRPESGSNYVLREFGLRECLLVGLGLIGCTPHAKSTNGLNVSSPSCVEDVNAAVSMFNDKLKSLADQLNQRFSADSKYIFINSTEGARDLASGFAVPYDPCCLIQNNGLCVPDQMPCQNRSEYLFWDGFHTTDVVNKIIATATYNVLLSSMFNA
ncbi:hypothetical protein RJT34_13937 [Clitoria ternatea]|uniref:Uncharacterized protein n=1 Tax=Clitoria ternatea TaxID=43366 RepID=A0AAN9JPV3_CLITE